MTNLMVTTLYIEKILWTIIIDMVVRGVKVIGRAGASRQSRTTGPRCLYVCIYNYIMYICIYVFMYLSVVHVPDTVNF